MLSGGRCGVAKGEASEGLGPERHGKGVVAQRGGLDPCHCCAGSSWCRVPAAGTGQDGRCRTLMDVRALNASGKCLWRDWVLPSLVPRHRHIRYGTRWHEDSSHLKWLVLVLGPTCAADSRPWGRRWCRAKLSGKPAAEVPAQHACYLGRLKHWQPPTWWFDTHNGSPRSALCNPDSLQPHHAPMRDSSQASYPLRRTPPSTLCVFCTCCFTPDPRPARTMRVWLSARPPLSHRNMPPRGEGASTPAWSMKSRMMR